MSWVRIGLAANLLLGWRPVWDASRADGSPLRAPPVEAVTTFPVEGEDDEGAAWGPLRVSAHADAPSLGDALLDHRVVPFAGGGAFSLGLGTLVLGSGDREGARAALGAFASMELRDGLAYLLVKRRRIAGSWTHEALTKPPRLGFDRRLHLTADGQRSERMLRPGPRPSSPGARRLGAAAAQRYVEHFSTYGTHFVSTVHRGDVLLQVYAFDPATLEALRAGIGWPPDEPVLAGDRAAVCASFVTHAVDRGPVVSVNRDPALDVSVAEGAWHDDRWGNSLFTPLASHPERATEAFGGLRRTAPVALELMPLNRFLEFYRAMNWQRLLIGALWQNYGDAVEFGLAADAVSAADVPAAVEPLLVGQPPWNAPAGGPRGVRAYAERLTGRRVGALPAHDGPTTLATHLLRLSPGARIRVPGTRVTVGACQIRTAATSTAQAPELAVHDDAFDAAVLVADEVQGPMRVTDVSGTAVRSVVDGFVFQAGGLDGGPVRVEAATHEPPAAVAGALAPLVAVSLRTVERLLCQPDDGAGAAVRRHLGWVGGIVAAAGPGDELLRLAARVGSLRWAAGAFRERGIGRDLAEVRAYLDTVLGALERASVGTTGSGEASSGGAGGLRELLLAARDAHEQFWHRGPSLRRHTAARARDAALEFDAALRRLRDLAGSAGGELVLAALGTACADPPAGGLLDAEPPAGLLTLEAPGGEVVAIAVQAFGRRLRAAVGALRRIEGSNEPLPDALARAFDLAPPWRDEWEAFAGHAGVLAGTTGSPGAVADAVSAARASLDARASDIVVRAAGADACPPPDGPVADRSSALAELHLLRAHALALARELDLRRYAAAPPTP